MMDIARTWTWFHQHAEISFREEETSAEIKRILGSIEGVELLDLGLPTGALARIRGKGKGPCVMLRADIDALPLHEETGLPHPSLDPGAMHACGHDFHITNLLRTAEILACERERIGGTVLLLFQPGEESGGGAKKVIATGILSAYGVERAFGIHIQPMLGAGTVALCAGPISAAVDRFSIRIRGAGCHGARPYEGLDPIPAACQLAASLESIVSRRLKPSDRAVVSVTRIESGSSWNVIPGEALLEGTNRTFDPSVRSLIKQCFAQKCRALEEEGYRVDLDLRWGTPATDNDPLLTDMVRSEAEREGLEVLDLRDAETGGEDFAYYQQQVPGVFYHVGVGGSYPLHSPRLQVDLAALEPSARLMARVALLAAENG